ncbi:proteoglycan 4-like [Fopius arisanus]|uniref:Proteoglycan 4-like n=1 Tax=Fopius arisanus TaxID=64838 RepID=A0A9R1TP78_9HYME|nr:PREDICTED: proteoglycan 4-like [Fopius arisanus]
MPDLDAGKLVLPRELRPQAISHCHDLPQAGHLEVDKTYRRLYEAYYWPNMFRDVVAFVRHCDIYQRCKVNTTTPAPQTEGSAPTVDLTGSSPPASPQGPEIKEETGLITSQQRAARTAELALERILFPEGIPAELDDFALPEDSDDDLASAHPREATKATPQGSPKTKDPPPRGPLSPVTVLEKLPPSGNPEGLPSPPAGEAPIYLQDYWDPVRLWLSEMRSIEEHHPGFTAALHACTLTPTHHLSGVRFTIPSIPLESVSGEFPQDDSEEKLPEAASVARSSERAPTPPAHPIVKIGSSSSSSNSSSSTSCSSSSSESGDSLIPCPEPEEGDPGRPSDDLEDQEVELAPIITPLTNPQAGERTPPHPPLKAVEDGKKPPEVTPPGSRSALAAVANHPGKPARAPESAARTAEAPPRQAAVHSPKDAAPDTRRPGLTTKRGPPRRPSGGKRRKPRHWCFDCRRHGHTHQACPNPTGEIFCGQCPHRLRADRVCPEHGPVAQPAGGRTTGYSEKATETPRAALPPRAAPAPSGAAPRCPTASATSPPQEYSDSHPRRERPRQRSPSLPRKGRTEDYWAPFGRTPVQPAAVGLAYPLPREEEAPEDSGLRFFWQPPDRAPTSLAYPQKYGSRSAGRGRGYDTQVGAAALGTSTLGRGTNARFGPPTTTPGPRWPRGTLEALQSILDQARRDQQLSPEPGYYPH